MLFVLFVVSSALAAEDDALSQARDRFNRGDMDGTLQAAKDVVAQSKGNVDAVLSGLELMAQCYERLSEPEKELNCYAQIGTMRWMQKFTLARRDRMLGRVAAIAQRVETARGLEPAEVVRLSTSILGLRRPLLFDDIGPGVGLDVRMLDARAKAYDALGEGDKARKDRLAALALPAREVLARRYAVAIALLEGEAAANNDAPVQALLLNTADDPTAFICQAALTHAAIQRGQGAVAQARLQALFYLCWPQDDLLNILAEETAQLAAAKDKLGLAPETALLLTQFAARRPEDPQGHWDTAALVFPVESLAGALPDAEAAAVRARFGPVQPRDATVMRRRVRLLLLLGDVEGALAEAYAAYQTAPRGTTVQADAVRDLVNCAKARNGVFLDPKPFLQFAAFGPAGRDGRPGTADDLTDPFPALLRRAP